LGLQHTIFPGNSKLFLPKCFIEYGFFLHDVPPTDLAVDLSNIKLVANFERFDIGVIQPISLPYRGHSLLFFNTPQKEGYFSGQLFFNPKTGDIGVGLSTDSCQ
jgi:hypothetical protein